MAPSVSAASRFRIRPPRLRICSIPIASTTVTAAGRPDGIVATATAIAMRRISIMPTSRTKPRSIITTIATRTTYERKRATF